MRTARRRGTPTLKTFVHTLASCAFSVLLFTNPDRPRLFPNPVWQDLTERDEPLFTRKKRERLSRVTSSGVKRNFAVRKRLTHYRSVFRQAKGHQRCVRVNARNFAQTISEWGERRQAAGGCRRNWKGCA